MTHFQSLLSAHFSHIKYVQDDLGSSDFTNEEFEAYQFLASLIRPRNYMEVGVYCGYSALAVAIAARPTLQNFVGLDAQMYRRDSNDVARRVLERAKFLDIISCDFDIHTIDTQDPDSNVQDRLPLITFDWVHIDGDHTVAGAINDIVNLWGAVRRIMTVHDVESHPEVHEAVDYVLKNRELLPGLRNYGEVKSSHGFFVLSKN